MVQVRRLFVLLSACEDLTERETAALRRGAVEQAIAFAGRKHRIGAEIERLRDTAELSSDEIAVLNQRMRRLVAQEKENLTFLREEMNRVRAALGSLQSAVKKMRRVRRGYAGTGIPVSSVESVLGRA